MQASPLYGLPKFDITLEGLPAPGSWGQLAYRGAML